MRHRQAGSAQGERLIAYAIVALYFGVLAAAFSQSLALGFTLVGVTLLIALLVFAFGYWRDQRAERRVVDARRSDLEQAAAAHGAEIETVFVGRGEGGGFAAFGVAGAARKLLFARETYGKERASVVGFDELAAAFARPDGEKRYRLEARTRAGDNGAPRVALFLRVEERAEAGRWVQALQPHLGDKVRFIESADD